MGTETAGKANGFTLTELGLTLAVLIGAASGIAAMFNSSSNESRRLELMRATAMTEANVRNFHQGSDPGSIPVAEDLAAMDAARMWPYGADPDFKARIRSCAEKPGGSVEGCLEELRLQLEAPRGYEAFAAWAAAEPERPGDRETREAGSVRFWADFGAIFEVSLLLACMAAASCLGISRAARRHAARREIEAESIANGEIGMRASAALPLREEEENPGMPGGVAK